MDIANLIADQGSVVGNNNLQMLAVIRVTCICVFVYRCGGGSCNSSNRTHEISERRASQGNHIQGKYKLTL